MGLETILLDTNIYSDAMRGIDGAVTLLRRAEKVLMSPIVIGELLSGFKKGKKESKNKDTLNRFLIHDRVQIVSLTEKTADRYSFIFDHLRKDGNPIPTNDIWIVASSLEHGAKLATRDKHFDKIKGIYILGY